MNVLQEVIIMHMKCVKYQNNKELLLMPIFIKIVKTELTNEQYKVILEKANGFTHFNEQQYLKENHNRTYFQNISQ